MFLVCVSWKFSYPTKKPRNSGQILSMFKGIHHQPKVLLFHKVGMRLNNQLSHCRITYSPLYIQTCKIPKNTTQLTLGLEGIIFIGHYYWTDLFQQIFPAKKTVKIGSQKSWSVESAEQSNLRHWRLKVLLKVLLMREEKLFCHLFPTQIYSANWLLSCPEQISPKLWVTTVHWYTDDDDDDDWETQKNPDSLRFAKSDLLCLFQFSAALASGMASL